MPGKTPVPPTTGRAWPSTGNAAANIPSLVGLDSRLNATGMATLLKTGRGVMPAYGFLPDADRSALGHYLLGTAATAEVESAGRKVEPTGGTPAAGIPYTTTGYNRFIDPDGYPALRLPWGTLNALDLNTGEYLWRKPLGEYPERTAQGIPPTGTENYGGPLVTAGNLIFIAATKDEKIRAFDKATGEILWEATLPAGGFATPATYAVNGRQFVVIACVGKMAKYRTTPTSPSPCPHPLLRPPQISNVALRKQDCSGTFDKDHLRWSSLPPVGTTLRRDQNFPASRTTSPTTKAMAPGAPPVQRTAPSN